MTDLTESEVIEVGDLDPEQWNDYAEKQGWSDGMPLMVPTEEKVAALVATCRGDNEPFPPMPPRRVIPTMQSIAANAAMAGCRPEYFPVVVTAVRALLNPEYNLHGTLATTHPCAPGIILGGPIREQLGINCGSNCFGQGTRSNATIGRAVQLTLLNVGAPSRAKWTGRRKVHLPNMRSASAKMRPKAPGRLIMSGAVSKRPIVW